MVEEQVELEVLSPNFERDLAADEREADTQLDEELAQVCEEFPFEVALVCFLRESQEIEVVGIFDELLCKIGLRRRKSHLEIGDRFPLPAIQGALDLHHQDVPAPAVLYCLLGVPKPLLPVLHLLQEREVVIPGQLCKRLLHNCFIGPRFC